MQKLANFGYELLGHLLPDFSNFQLNGWQYDEATPQITLVISSTRIVVKCPLCNQQTRKVHSRYERKLTALPWANYSIILQLKVRKFFCINLLCRQQIFTERLASITAPWARKTKGLVQRLTAIGLALGGKAGVKLAQHLGLIVSRNTLLQLVRNLPLPEVVTPITLGVDDFAIRKHHTYGTVLIDLEQSRPIALLGDRESETLAAWLKAHPGIKVVSRDRSKAYEKGILQGAPQAIQVADRFHLLQNLAETLTQVFNAHTKELKAVELARNLASVTQKEDTTVVAVLRPPLLPKEQLKAIQRRERRLSNYEQVWALHHQGWSAPAIAKQLGIGRTTVFCYLRTSTFPERRGRSDCGRSLLDPFKDYILQKWNNGCHDTKGLFEEIQQYGYSGSYDTVARYTRRLRQSQTAESKKRLTRMSRKRLPIVVESSKRSFTPSRATWLVLQRQELQEADDKQMIALLRSQHPALDEAIELSTGFALLVRQRQPDQFDPWLEQAINSTLSPFQRFAARLQLDYDAVKAGVTLPTNNGPVEGHINRLKMLKRQMYGRAKLDLLSRRFLVETSAVGQSSF